MTTPPTAWLDARECPRDGCSETFFTTLGMGYHLIHEHGEGGIRSVPERAAGAGADS